MELSLDSVDFSDYFFKTFSWPLPSPKKVSRNVVKKWAIDYRELYGDGNISFSWIKKEKLNPRL